MVAVLQPVNGAKYIPIDRAVVLVGRSADCDAVITNSKKISRKHCCLVQVDDMYYIRDLGSMNGVWLNGARVKREVKMSLGDHVAIGDVEFRFHPNAKVEEKKTMPVAPPSAGHSPRAASPAKDEFEVVEAVLLDDDGNPVEKMRPAEDLLVLDDDDGGNTNEVAVIDADIVDDEPAEEEKKDDGNISMPVLNLSDSLPELASDEGSELDDDDDILKLDD